jgi:hypothetical protein
MSITTSFMLSAMTKIDDASHLKLPTLDIYHGALPLVSFALMRTRLPLLSVETFVFASPPFYSSCVLRPFCQGWVKVRPTSDSYVASILFLYHVYLTAGCCCCNHRLHYLSFHFMTATTLPCCKNPNQASASVLLGGASISISYRRP